MGAITTFFQKLIFGEYPTLRVPPPPAAEDIHIRPPIAAKVASQDTFQPTAWATLPPEADRGVVEPRPARKKKPAKKTKKKTKKSTAKKINVRS